MPKPSGEELIDTEMASSIAPDSKVRVYATTSLSNTDVDNGYEAVILDLANGFKITQVSISLGQCETLVPKGEFLTDEYYHAILSSLSRLFWSRPAIAGRLDVSRLTDPLRTLRTSRAPVPTLRRSAARR